MNYRYSQPYNIYFGTIGKTLGVRYRFTKNFRNENDAKEYAKKCANSFYYKNEGKHGLPSYIQIYKESELTGVDMQVLYKEHIDDMMRWYAIRTEEDTVPNSKIKW